MGKLTATGVQQAKGRAKPTNYPTAGGLCLLVNTNGTKYWRYNYRYAGKRKTLALGVYPDTSLAGARKLHQTARETLAKDIDPGEAKRIERITRHLASADSFEAVATEWYTCRLKKKSDSYRDRTRSLLKNDLYPSLGSRPISQIISAELLMVLRKLEVPF
jgi:Arm DNA-binding domain